MGFLLEDFAILDDENQIRDTNGREAMGNDKAGPILQHVRQAVLNLPLRLRVNR